MAIGLVADHAVGGVDRLVGDGAGKTGSGHPEQRRDHPVGEVLCKAFDRGAADACFGQVARVSSDDHRHRLPPGLDTARLESPNDGDDMAVEAALRQQARAQDAAHQGGQERLQQEAGREGDREKQKDGRDAANPARLEALPFVVPVRVAPGDQAPQPGDGMSDRAVEAIGIGDQRFQGDGDEGDPGRHRPTSYYDTTTPATSIRPLQSGVRRASCNGCH